MASLEQTQAKPDSYWMQHAIQLAQKAEQQGEVPVGAVLVKNNQMIAQGWNQSISLNDPTAHAEIIVLRQAAQLMKNYRLLGTTLYVTLEPCCMCAGALVHSRIERLVFAATDPKAGAVASVFNVLQSDQLNHRVVYHHGILAKEAGALLKQFFKVRRNI